MYADLDNLFKTQEEILLSAIKGEIYGLLSERGQERIVSFLKEDFDQVDINKLLAKIKLEYPQLRIALKRTREGSEMKIRINYNGPMP